MVFDEFKDKKNILSLISAIRKISNDNYRIMEVCGGQTHSIVKYGIEDLLPDNVTLIHGPGCPVCVTPEAMIDKAIELSNNPGCIICTFGDMMRVPGSEYSLSYSKTKGNDIRIVYSPLDAIKIAKDNPKKEIVFWGIGFETTAPIYSLLIEKIISSEIKNMSVLTSLVTVPAAIRNLLSDEECNINGLLGAGHVCAISGFNQYESIARQDRTSTRLNSSHIPKYRMPASA